MASENGVLYLIPTVIAENTQDQVINPFTKQIIKSLTHFITENTRTSRRYISSLKIDIPIESLSFCEMTKDSSISDITPFCNLLLKGINVGVLSEAGCPGIADPGAIAVKWAHKNGIKVIPLVGPSSITMALMASGFSGQSFTFHGYLPIQKNERIQAIRQLEKDAYQFSRTQIFIETPYRNMKLLEDLITTCQPVTKLCIACDITAPTEYIKTQAIQQWKLTKVDLDKKPSIFLIYC